MFMLDSYVFKQNVCLLYIWNTYQCKTSGVFFSELVPEILDFVMAKSVNKLCVITELTS